MPASVRVPSLVRNIDIMPTVQDYIGIHPKCDGESLFEMARAAESNTFLPDREVFSCSGFSSDTDPVIMRMLISPQRMKYIATRDKAGDLKAEELYDLAKDPDERRNLASDRPDVLSAMRRRMAEVYAREVADQTRSSRDSATPSPAPTVTRRLRSLGYLR